MYCCLKSYSVLQESRNLMKHNILFSVSLSVSFCMFPCRKGHFIRAYLDTIQMTLFITTTIRSTLPYNYGQCILFVNLPKSMGGSNHHPGWEKFAVQIKVSWVMKFFLELNITLKIIARYKVTKDFFA